MATELNQRRSPIPYPAPWGLLPARLRVLYVVACEPIDPWLETALAADSACEVELHAACGAADACERLREETFDAIVVQHHEERLDALEFVAGVRGGGAEEPLLILGTEDPAVWAAYAYEVGADAYLPVHNTSTRTFIWTLARAVDRHHLCRENRRLSQGEKQRLQHEHQEADTLLSQQRALIQNLQLLSTDRAESQPAVSPVLLQTASGGPRPSLLPDWLVSHYRELLRAHVMMGFGNLGDEMTRLAGMLSAADVTAQQTMLLHLQALEDLVQGLGSRSARHVLSRADLLILEVMIHLVDDYRAQRIVMNAEAPTPIPVKTLADLL